MTSTTERLAGGRLGPDDVPLAVEVVSPGSVRMDRVAKPAQYAAGGIPHLWRSSWSRWSR